MVNQPFREPQMQAKLNYCVILLCILLTSNNFFNVFSVVSLVMKHIESVVRAMDFSHITVKNPYSYLLF